MVLILLPNRQDAVAEMARLCRTGRRVVAMQQGIAMQLNHPPAPGREAHLRAFFASAFPDWRLEALPGMMAAAGLRDIDMQMSTDRLCTFIGPATEAQIETNRNVVEPAAARLGDVLHDPAATASLADRSSARIARADTTTLTPFCVATGTKE
jgi:hypothetical protein